LCQGQRIDNLPGVSRTVVVVAFEGCQSLDVTGPFEVFAGATEALKRSGSRARGYRVLLAGPKRGALRSESGLGLVPAVTLRELLRRGAPAIDTLIVAGGFGTRRAARDASSVELIRRLARRARRVTSVCTGSFVLAAAGLLDGRRATTHWAFCDELAQSYPAVQLERDPIYVRDGRYWTSAGVTAGIDLALALVEADLGRQLSLQVARWMVVFVRRAGGQSQFSATLSAQTAERAPLRELQAYILEHPEAVLDVPSLARRVALSARHFSRLFREEIGVSPASFVEAVRVEAARRLLETRRDGVEGVAAAAGFGTPEALRRAFARRVGLSPREYRARFGGLKEEGPS
jgi:transcriptional regulator GlxA family with amidase domain